jgi:hypothetical protein
MLVKIFLFAFFLGLSLSGAAQTTTDVLPDSDIDIPIHINLKALAGMADKNVDTVFTSPNYPNDWVQADCATRYMYRFRRSPFHMSMQGNSLTLAFTGFYQIIGSTRACVKNTVLSPWTPACKCGFNEPERKVDISFTNTFRLQPNHWLLSDIKRNEPKAVDKCEVCFWGQDVTSSVLAGLKSELDVSRKAMADSFGRFNLRPFMQQAWDKMNAVYPIPGIGYFTLNPKKLRMENLSGKGDWLQLNIGITASPVVSMTRPEGKTSAVPDLSTTAQPGGFAINLEAALQYDSLSKVLEASLFNKRFDVGEGLLKKHIIIRGVEVSGNEQGQLLITLDFSGSFDGTVYFTGRPVYNAQKKAIEVENLEYNLQTKNLLLKTAKWLFNSRIVEELKKNTSFDMTAYYAKAAATLNEWLNKEWTPGIKGSGKVSELSISSLQALPQHLRIRTACAGKLSVQVSQINLGK